VSLDIFRVGDWSAQYSYSFRAVEKTEIWCYSFGALEVDEEEEQGTMKA
jgi:hypothetical protein